jgi:hypothetical protein
MSDLRHIHDQVLSFLKMEGIRLPFYYSSPTPPANRSHTCAYVTRIAFVLILVPLSSQKPLPHMCLSNAYEG